VLGALAALGPFQAAEEKEEAGFVPMFNGKDLTGWVNVNCAPSTFFAKGGEIVTTGKPTGFLRTERQYENFIAEFEWMHVNKKEVGNSGFFVWADPLPAVGTGYTRGIEVQVLVNLTYTDKKTGKVTATSHGDLFSIWGATCKPDRPHPLGWARCLPSEDRCKGGGEWNHYKVVAKDGAIKLHVNGKEVSGVSACRPRKGYLALESEGAECHFRNLKIKELPSSKPRPEEVAEVALGFKNLYTGLDLSGWQAGAGAKKHWQPRDWVLHYDGKGEALRTEKEFGDAEFVVDFRFRKGGGKEAPCRFVLREGKAGKTTLSVRPDGSFTVDAEVVRKEGGAEGSGTSGKFDSLKPVGQWNRLRATLRGEALQVTINGGRPVEMGKALRLAKGAFALRPGAEMDFGNLFVRELRK
jgi:hypothetical protein